MDIQDALEIDPTALDVEWVNQPKLYMKFAEAMADAREEEDRAKLNVEMVKSDLVLNIRDKPEIYKLDRVTESSVDAAVKADRDYQHAEERLSAAKRQVNLLGNALTAIDQRKRALENLVTLLSMQYFAGPHVPRDVEAEVIKSAERSIPRERAREKINRNRKRD